MNYYVIDTKYLTFIIVNIRLTLVVMSDVFSSGSVLSNTDENSVVYMFVDPAQTDEALNPITNTCIDTFAPAHKNLHYF